MNDTIRPVLAGQKALVVGVANDQSIAYGCAKAFRMAGADLAVTWLNEKARPHVEPLAQELEAPLSPRRWMCRSPGQLEAVFDHDPGAMGPARHPRPLDRLRAEGTICRAACSNCSAEGFAKAMDISCHSFVRMAKLAAPLMTDGGTMFAMSYYGANRVVPNYNVMGPVKAALEAACRYLAYELGPQGIRVHAISPGPLKTRAASGLKDFELLLNEAAQKAPDRRTGRHHGCRLHLRLSGDAVRAAGHRRHGLCRWRRQYHRVKAGFRSDFRAPRSNSASLSTNPAGHWGMRGQSMRKTQAKARSPERRWTRGYLSADERRAAGKAIRDATPRESQGGWKAPKDRRDPIDLLDRVRTKAALPN